MSLLRLGLCLLAALTLQLATGSTAFAQIKLKVGPTGFTDEKDSASFIVELENQGTKKLKTGLNVKSLLIANTTYNAEKFTMSTVNGTTGTVLTTKFGIVVVAMDLPVTVTLLLDDGTTEVTGTGDVKFMKVAEAPPADAPPLGGLLQPLVVESCTSQPSAAWASGSVVGSALYRR